MAKKKIEEKTDVSDAVIKDIKKKYEKYGEVIKTGEQIIEKRSSQKILGVSPIIDLTLKGGIKEGTWLMLSGAPKCGKAQPINEIVYTPYGPQKIGSIKIGDYVCSPNGQATRVNGVFPQGFKDVYKLSFSDGTSSLCCEEHLWLVKRNKANAITEIKATKELIGDLSYYDRDKWSIPVSGSIFFRNEYISFLDPYFLGILLSWASIKKSIIRFKKIPDHLVPVIAKYCQQYNCKLINNRIISDDNPETSGVISSHLISIGANYYNKYKKIHNLFKYSSEQDRIQIIRGIFTRGAYQHREGYIEYDCRNYHLLNDVTEVVRSLGYFCKTSVRKNEFRLVINTDEPFALLKNVPYETTKKKKFKTIKNIEHVGREDCVCIKVENEDGLYVTSGINVTHNTTTAMQIAYNAQKEDRKVIYINTEGRLDVKNFDIPGLDPSKMIIVTSEKEPLSAEQFLDIVVQLISAEENRGAICIIDSLSSLTPSKELTEEVSGSMRPGLPKILSNFCKKAGQIVPNNDIIMIAITHMITNTSGYGHARMADGGVKIQFQADTKMEVTSIEPWLNDEDQIGQAVNWKVHYSCLGGNGKCQSWIRYGQGIDSTQELVVLGIELGLINKSGAWFALEFLGEETPTKLQGQEKVYNYLIDNPDALLKLDEKIKEILS